MVRLRRVSPATIRKQHILIQCRQRPKLSGDLNSKQVISIVRLIVNNKQVQRRLLRVLYIFGLVVLVAGALFYMYNGKSPLLVANRAQESAGSEGPPQHLRIEREENSPAIRRGSNPIVKDRLLVPDDDPSIVALTEQLKQLEAGRTTFCREIENEKRILQEFVVDHPSPEEAERIKRLIRDASGLTEDQNGRLITWRERLGSEFLWPEEFRHLIVTTIYDKKTGRGRYTSIGVREGNLLMRDGNAPIPADGLINTLFSGVRFSYESNWRFSHLFHLDEIDPEQR